MNKEIERFYIPLFVCSTAACFYSSSIVAYITSRACPCFARVDSILSGVVYLAMTPLVVLQC